jgi:hypothetical protein
VQTIEPDKHGKLRITGIQRPVNRRQVRDGARSLLAGQPMQVVEVALYRNSAWLPDGQHRALMAVAARIPIDTVARHMTADEMRNLFSGQAKGRKVDPNVLILAADDPLSEYIQDAVTDSSHPWNSLVHSTKTDKKRISPNQLRQALNAYVGNTLHVSPSGASILRTAESKGFDFSPGTKDKELADELAELIKPFGNKQTNPVAFSGHGFRAIVGTAVKVIRRDGNRSAKAINRWKRHMPQMPFEKYARIKGQSELSLVLVQWWNKSLSQEKRIPVVDFNE